MAGSGKRGGPDRVLESRHLVGIFLGVVLLCSVFFTLGYVMGRQQYGGSVHAAEAVGKLISSSPSPAPVKPKAAEPSVAPANSEWDFYSKKDAPAAEPNAKTAAPTPAVATRKPGAPAPATTTPVAASTKPSAHLQSPKMGKGAIVVQVAALTRENDALAMADTIQQKKFPAFVVTPAGDNYYRVQVGPYSDEKSADAAKHALEQLGFKPIIKR
ncbi:MAG TPA: SPOR domain-containing protein [Candidatus Sulfotelmatobacter sp.]|nr:SPOR domain-containing protein [Candidatus Sulfotelmatobacter sp.]